MIKEYMARLETKLEAKKERNYFASVFAVNPNNWNIYYSSLNIERICCKENHRVNSLGLNGSKIHAIYLVEFLDDFEKMMA